jgi:hypoxanthine phosphoribosyltransferase
MYVSSLLFFVLFSMSKLTADTLTPYISADRIQHRIKDVAVVLDREYQDKNLVVLSVMKSAICVTADLIRELQVPHMLYFMRASSYGQNGTKSGTLTLHGLDELDFDGKDILVVDDIFDTGKTMWGIVEKLKEKKPRSVKTLVLLSKNVSRTIAYRPDYVLFDIENEFVVGYGMDYKEYYRNLPAIYIICPSEESGS